MSIESMKRFADEIRKVIDYYASEFNITYAEVIGVMHMIIMDIHAESWESLDDVEEREEEERYQGPSWEQGFH